MQRTTPHKYCIYQINKENNFFIISNGQTLHFNEINLSQMTGHCVIIVASNDSCVSQYLDTLFIDTSNM